MQIVRIKLGMLLAALLLAGAMRPAGPALAESKAELDALNKEVHQLYQAGKYEEAIPVARRQVEVAEKSSHSQSSESCGSPQQFGGGS